ncbi:hypothetical protein [Actinophytocola sp.]
MSDRPLYLVGGAPPTIPLTGQPLTQLPFTTIDRIRTQIADEDGDQW